MQGFVTLYVVVSKVFEYQFEKDTHVKLGIILQMYVVLSSYEILIMGDQMTQVMSPYNRDVMITLIVD